MSSAKVTLIGMHILYQNAEKDLFEFLTVPDGISRQTVIDTILMNGGEYETLYADPSHVHDSIAVWSYKWQHTMERWIQALNTDYEPLWNYDRNERETRTPNITNKRVPDLTDTNGGTVTEEHSRSAFDSSNYQPSDKDVTTPANTLHTTGSDTYTETGTENWMRRMYGNIGVMTSQDMLKQELEVSVWSLYDSIARLFLQEYVIPVMI